MMRTWTLRALFAVAVAASAVRASPPESPGADDKLTQVLNELHDVKARLADIQAAQDGQIKLMQDDVARLRADVDRLQDEVHRLSRTTTTTAASINPDATASPLPAGAILVDNQCTSPATVFVNGKPYRVLPFTQARIDGVPGRFSYSVSTDDFGLVQGPSLRTMIAGRDFPILIHP